MITTMMTTMIDDDDDSDDHDGEPNKREVPKRSETAHENTTVQFHFYLFSCIQWILFVSWFLVSSCYLFLILGLFVHPLASSSVSGLCRRTSFSIKVCVQKSLLAKWFLHTNLDAFGACKKLLRTQPLHENPNFWKRLWSRASLGSPLDAWE